VTSVSSNGHCTSTGSAISCNVHLHAPSCTCRGDGGQVVIGFDVTSQSWLGKGLLSGTVNVTSLAPSLYGVPSTPLPPDVNCSAAHLSKATARVCAAAHA
jgi:hypothetical protein